MNSKDKQFLIECLCSDILLMIMEEYDCDEQKAMDILYSSSTLQKIEDPDTGLYYQGSVYVFEFLKEELANP